MRDISVVVLYHLFLLLLIGPCCLSSAYEGPLYDNSAYTEALVQCRTNPEEPLYNGGILKDQVPDYQWLPGNKEIPANNNLPILQLKNLTRNTYYSFSSWVRVHDVESVVVRVSLVGQTVVQDCIGTVLAKSGCWSFLKGGFVMNSPSNISVLYFQASDGKNVKIEFASSALQPFTKEEWITNQQGNIDKVISCEGRLFSASFGLSENERKRQAVIHVSNSKGLKLQGAAITIKQVTEDFLIGSAIGKTIIGNLHYQNWFTKRFGATVFENELKWDTVQSHQDHINYSIADQMMKFVRANKIVVRGRSNIFWEDPRYVPKWVHNLTGSDLYSAVSCRVHSLLSKYKEEFIHWDVGNPRFFDSYEQRIGQNATLSFIETAHRSDPSATLFMNEFNVVETCTDFNSTVDTYILRLRELKQAGITMNGIGLEGHFTIPNPPLIRGALDKLATLGLPIWFTEVDISKIFTKEKQALLLEEVLREIYSHPSVKGVMLWTALSPKGCYQMCLTDKNFQNLPAGDTVDKLLKEWQTGILEGQSNDHGSFTFHGFLGEYEVTARYGEKTVNSTFALNKGQDIKQIYLRI